VQSWKTKINKMVNRLWEPTHSIRPLGRPTATLINDTLRADSGAANSAELASCVKIVMTGETGVRLSK